MGRHGRESHAFAQGCALVLSLVVVPQLPPPSFPNQDLVPELVTKIAAAVASTPVHVVATGGDGADPARLRQLESEISRRLAARGLRVVDRAEGAALVTVTCSENLRERLCVAEIRIGAAANVVTAERPHDARARADHETSIAFELHVLFAQRSPILDLVTVGDRLLVLDSTAITMYQRSPGGWQAERSHPIASSRVWPRDMRGRLRVDGATLEAFLPGVTCRASLDSLNLSCVDDQQPWPTGIENTGVAAARNYFTTPEGLAFYGSAALESDAGARWLLAAQDGRLLFVDDQRRTLESIAGPADDVVGVKVACEPGTYVLLPSRATGYEGADTLGLFRVVSRRIIPAASPVMLPGPLTALWPASGANVATAVSFDPGIGRYEAFQVAISCGW